MAAVSKEIKEKYQLQEAQGVAYGVHNGYTVTVQDCRVTVSAGLMNPEAQKVMLSIPGLSSKKELGKYNIDAFGVNPTSVTVRFRNGISMKRNLDGLLSVITGRLKQIGAPGADYCLQCGKPFGEGEARTVMVNGVVYRMHDECAVAVETALADRKEQDRSRGSVLTGAVGALLGGIVGAIPWMIVSCLGYFVAWLGFLIGIAATKGYELLKGKNTRAKAVCVIIATVIGVLVAEIGAYVIVGLSDGVHLSVWRMARIVVRYILEDGRAITNLLLGLVFAGLGVIGLVKEMFAESSKKHNALIRLD